MNKFILAGKKRPSNIEAPEQWRAYDDGPISLTAKPTFDSATGQKAFVLGFAAVAIVGAAYFTTIMLAPGSDPSVVSAANARTQPVEEAAPAPVQPAAPGEAVAKPVEQPVATPPAPAEVAAAQPAPAPATDAGNTLAPNRVKTIAIPGTKTAATASSAASGLPTAQPASNQQVAAVAPAVESAPAINAYASNDAAVSEGIAAVMGLAIKEGAAEAPRRKAQNDGVQVADADDGPEMAGGKGRRTRSAVTMRSGPQKGAPAIGTIPGNTSVSVSAGCKSWCQVTYNGKRGYIYKGFLQ